MKKTILKTTIIGMIALIFAGCGHYEPIHYPSHKVHTHGVFVKHFAPVKRVYVYDSPVYVDSYSYQPTRYKNLYKEHHTITPDYYYNDNGYKLMYLNEQDYIIKP